MKNERLTSLLETLEERAIDAIKYDSEINIENFDNNIEKILKNEIELMKFENEEEKELFEYVVNQQKDKIIQNIFYYLY